MVLRPDSRIGTAIGAAVAFVALAGALFLVWQIAQREVSLATVTGALGGAILLGIAVLFAYWTIGCWNLRYILSKNRLIIRWAGNELSIPLHDITSVTRGDGVEPPEGSQGVRWPGYHIGQAAVEGLEGRNPVLFFTAYRSPAELVYVGTASGVYALSMPDVSRFMTALDQRRQDAATEGLITRSHRWFVADLAFWGSRWLTALVLAALVVNLGLFAYVAYWIPALPDLMQMHFSPLGVTDIVSPKTDLLALPAAGLAVLALNTLLSALALHRREGVAAYVLTATALVMQGVLWGSAQFLLS